MRGIQSDEHDHGSRHDLPLSDLPKQEPEPHHHHHHSFFEDKVVKPTVSQLKTVDTSRLIDPTDPRSLPLESHGPEESWLEVNLKCQTKIG